MKVYIRHDKNGQPISQNCYLAKDGFFQMGFELCSYVQIEDIIDNEPADIIVGSITDVRITLEKFGLHIPSICYPKELFPFLGRNLWKSTLFEVANHPENWNIFMKPAVDAKRFTGTIVTGTKDLIACNAALGNTEVWCSDIVHFLTEWRCFVRYGKILDVRKYKGHWENFPNPNIIKEAVKQYITAPNGYGIDFGVTKEGKTLLIEVNEGYSLGAYGLESISYAKLLSARWAELTNTVDECNF